MVGWMTYGKRKFEAKDGIMRGLIPPLDAAMRDLIPMIDADTNAFNDYMAALGMPKDGDEQKAARAQAMQDGLKKAIDVPLGTMRIAARCWIPMEEMARHGNLASKSDLEVGARSLETGIWGAYKNVMINIGGVTDSDYRLRIQAEAEQLVAEAKEKCISVLSILDARQD
jgi:glutamate formiminotransferase / formiminotetrahydrofolate cyclodeaminase